MMKPTTDQSTLQRLADRLAAESDVIVAIAFGSAADGKSRADSDLDLAACASAPLDPDRRRQLIRLAAEITGRPVDLVDLRTAGVAALRSALRNGRKLVCRDRRTYEQLISRLLVDTEDFLPYRQRMLKARRSAWMR